MPFEFTRRYSSRRSEALGPLGYGWDHNFNLRIVETTSGTTTTATLYNGNNRVDSYPLSGSPAAFVSSAGIYNTLHKETSPTTYYWIRRVTDADHL
jgi:hypothetical protein